MTWIRNFAFFIIAILTASFSYLGLTYFVVITNQESLSQYYTSKFAFEKIERNCQRKDLFNNIYQCYRGDFRRIQRETLITNYQFLQQETATLLKNVYTRLTPDNIEGNLNRDLDQLRTDLVLQIQRVVRKKNYLNYAIFPIELLAADEYQKNYFSKNKPDINIDTYNKLKASQLKVSGWVSYLKPIFREIRKIKVF